MDKRHKITREQAIQILSTRDAHGVLCGYTSGVTEALDMAIEALSEPNKSTNRTTGEWINKGEYAECSICGAHSARQFDGVELIPLKTNFCHHCGAEMKIPLYAYASWDRSEE